jgi:DNA primase
MAKRRRVIPGAAGVHAYRHSRRPRYDISDDVLTLLRPYLGDPIGPLSNSEKGRQAKYRCPFHKGGEESSPSFYVNIDTGISYCHTCHEWWWLRRLLHLMGARGREQRLASDLTDSARPPTQQRDWARDTIILPEALLGVFHRCPESLLDNGFDMATLRRHEVGVDLTHQRITYPLRDLQGNLVGISGGRTGDWQWPKYLFYNRDHLKPFLPDTPLPENVPEKSALLWNGHRVWASAYHGDNEDPIVVTEGYKACLWVIQSGFPTTVAIMGSYMSRFQRNILAHFQNKIVLFLDKDDAGIDGTQKAWGSLKKEGADINVAAYPEHLEHGQPDDLGPEEVAQAITNARRAP